MAEMGSLADCCVRPLTPSVGALVDGVDTARPLPPAIVARLRRAVLDHGVLFFRDQQLSDEAMAAFAAQFGRPISEPFVNATDVNAPPVGQADMQRAKHATAVWHSDTSFVPEPPTFTALRAVEVPAFGGDTCWSSMVAAYEALSDRMRQFLDGLSCVHSMSPVLARMGGNMARNYTSNGEAHGREHVHPLVRVHPETGRKALFYNEGWVVAISDLSPAESDSVIALLREHVKSPEFAMRWHWRNNDLALWDNRSVQHYAVPDYGGTRVMQRVVTAGETVIGPKI